MGTLLRATMVQARMIYHPPIAPDGATDSSLGCSPTQEGKPQVQARVNGMGAEIKTRVCKQKTPGALNKSLLRNSTSISE
jgi:hypothetical protein